MRSFDERFEELNKNLEEIKEKRTIFFSNIEKIAAEAAEKIKGE